jgi:hypothetical protein
MQNKNAKELLYRNADIKHQRSKSQETPQLDDSISIENNKPISQKDIQIVVHDFRNMDNQNNHYIDDGDSVDDVPMNIVYHVLDGLVPSTQHVLLPENVALRSILTYSSHRRELTREEIENINAQVSRNLPYCNKELAKDSVGIMIAGATATPFYLAIFLSGAGAHLPSPGVVGYAVSGVIGAGCAVVSNIALASYYNYKKRKDMKNNLIQSTLNNNFAGFTVENPNIQLERSPSFNVGEIQNDGQIDALNTVMQLNDDESIDSERSADSGIGFQTRNNNSNPNYALDL